jgi:nuclear polyadenylated RNA-binding protein NAB2
MGQVNRAMDRSNDSVLHRVRQGAGTGRINSHVQDAPKGPRNVQNRNVRPGMQKALNGMGMAGNGMMNNMMIPPQQAQMPMPLSPQQQMEMMAMMEQSARMMAQFMPGMVSSPTMNPIMQQNGAHQGKSLFDRVEAGPGKRGRGGRTQRNGSLRNNSAGSASLRDTAMDLSEKPSDSNPSSSMEAESSQPQTAEPSATMCRFNLRCTNKACPFVHQSPAAPEGVTIDMTDTCSFGAACKNAKCTARHPSPGQIKAHQSEEQCKFYPYCTNPSCPFKHPSMPMCRNGADCTVPHCKFTHLQTLCKFTPCKNVRCPYKHAEGQRGSYGDKVWTADGGKKEENHHVSERKFVEDDGEEELIKAEDVAAQAAELIT